MAPRGEDLYEKHARNVYRYLFSLSRESDTAEDLTQETFLKLFRSLPKYHGRNKFKSYLYTIANRLCIDESRKLSFYSLETVGDIADGRSGIAQVEHREDIRRLLGVLSAEQREAVILRFGQNLGFAEIAKVMGCSMRTAQSRVRNGLRLMRRELGDE